MQSFGIYAKRDVDQTNRSGGDGTGRIVISCTYVHLHGVFIATGDEATVGIRIRLCGTQMTNRGYDYRA